MNNNEGQAPENQPSPATKDYSIERELGLAVKICSGCGTSNLPTSEYCYKCGLKLPAESDLSHASKICTGCRTLNQPASKYCYKCGLKLPDQVVYPGDVSAMVPAGFWRRFASYIIDYIFVFISSLVISSIVLAIIFSIFPDLAEPYMISEYTWEAILSSTDRPYTSLDWFTLLGETLYVIAYWTVAVGWKGRTIGKLMLGMKVVRANGSRVGYFRALVRYIGYLICYMTLGLGFLVIAFNKQKRGLHDFICDTMVVRT